MPCRPWKRASSREANGICQNEERAGGRIVDRRGGCILQMLPGLSGHARLGCDYDQSCLPAPFRVLGRRLETVIVTRCGLTLCPLAIGAHLQTRRMLVSPGRSSGPVAVLKIPPRSCLALELPGLLVSESVQPRRPRFGQLRSVLGPSVVGRFGWCVVVESKLYRLYLGVNTVVQKRAKKKGHF